jgi:hypothetical protein
MVEMTSREDLVNAISLNSSIVNGARVVGPSVAGLLMAKVGIAMCFFPERPQLFGRDRQPSADALAAVHAPAAHGFKLGPCRGRFLLRLASSPNANSFDPIRGGRCFSDGLIPF